MSSACIMVAPNGARRTKSDHPAIPLTVAETVETAAACHRAGAHALHLHVRDTDGTHSLDAGRYRETLGELAHKVPGMAVQITTEAADRFDVPDQLACLRAVRPGWASIALREIARAPDLAETLYATCADQGTKLQHILYDAQDLARLYDWQDRGIVREGQTDMLFVLGRYGGPDGSRSADLDPFLAQMRVPARWMLCAFGPTEHDCLLKAARLGGDLRVGFENSLTAPDGTVWPDCTASVAALAQSLRTPDTLAAPDTLALNES